MGGGGGRPGSFAKAGLTALWNAALTRRRWVGADGVASVVLVVSDMASMNYSEICELIWECL